MQLTQGSEEKFINDAIVRILRASVRKTQEPDIVFLSDLSEHLTSKNQATLNLHEHVFEVALVERLSMGFKDPHTPAVYLSNCYRRAISEIISAKNQKVSVFKKPPHQWLLIPCNSSSERIEQPNSVK